MSITTPQRYRALGLEREVDPNVLKNAISAIEQIASVNPQLFPLLSLNHLSHVTGLSYGFLRESVGRRAGRYRHFYMRKKIPGRRNLRMISVPDRKTRICQRWISENILSVAQPHSSSFAYHPDSNSVWAAQVHVNARWLVKVDVLDFFHSITEHQVYEVFRSLGYARLLSFEMARLCTMANERMPKDRANEKYLDAVIDSYYSPHLGILPQGAPTSPMLSNLVMRGTDRKLTELAAKVGMRYSRYADDIVFSCENDRTRSEINCTKRSILQILNEEGFRPNLRKTVVRGPADRKVVLGLLVDGPRPRLTKEFKDNIRLHLYYLRHPNHGPASHAKSRNTSVSRLHHHIFGLICWARAVDPSYGLEILSEFESVAWPPINRSKFYSKKGKH